MIPLPVGYKYIDEWRYDITSPAFTNPSRGEVHINHPAFDKLSPDQQDFIVLHELAHQYTADEFKADEIAFYNLMKRKNSPKIAPTALFNALSGIIPEHTERYLRMLTIAAQYDIEVNGNGKAQLILNEINKLNTPTMKKLDEQTQNEIIDQLMAKGYTEDEAIDMIIDYEADDDGIYYASDKKAERQAKKEAKKAAKAEKKAAKQARKDQKAQAKADKKTLKNEAKQARIERKNKIADARANKINAKAEGIANGTYDPLGGLGNALGGVVDKIKGADGGYVEEEKSNLPLILGIGGGVLVLVVIIVVVMAQRK